MSEEIKETVVEKDAAVSKSKAKREARKAEAKADKVKKNFDAILGWIIGIVCGVVVIGAIVMGIITNTPATVASSDFSFGLTAEGYVENANLNNVKDLGLNNLVIPAAEVEYTDDEVQSDIDSFVSYYVYYDDDASLTVTDGDTINLNYSGSIDGVVFDGGTADNQTLTIGSHYFIDDFEEQLIGLHPGDSKDVVVTFPDPYDNNPDLSGKEAVFACTVNSIEKTPELTDDFVAENAGGHASTVEELKAYFKQNGTDSNVKTYISTYISDNAEAKGAPKSYIKNIKGLTKYTDEQSYQYYNEYYYQYFGTYMYSSFEDYTQMTTEEYEKSLKEAAASQVALDLTYEKYFKDNNLTVSEETYNDLVASYGGEESVSMYGEPFIRQLAIKYTVIEHLFEIATVQ